MPLRREASYDDQQTTIKWCAIDGSARPLEYALIDQFLAEHGHTLQSVDKLPPEERRELLRRGSSYATLRLAEIESRAHFADDLER